MKRYHNIEKFLEETPEAYYWIGFLMADGHFYEDGIAVGSSVKDYDHLVKLAKFVGLGADRIATSEEHESTIRGKSIESGKSSKIFIGSRKVSIAIRSKFDIHKRKTYNPPDPSVICRMPDDLFLSWLIGFIDGDGCIMPKRGRLLIAVKLHASWHSLLVTVANRISGMFTFRGFSPYIDKDGFTNLRTERRKVVELLAAKALEFDLPVLNRKWGYVWD